MSTRPWFPTLIYEAQLAADECGDVSESGVEAAERLRAELLAEARQIREIDEEGRAWCRENYPSGFTSYASMNALHRMSPVFEELGGHLVRHATRYARELDYDVDTYPLALTDCWVNLMPRHCAHGLHLHPTSTISGTYYVDTPPGCSAIQFEDPRLSRKMAAPPQVAEPRDTNRAWVSYPVSAGNVVLFESWLRHRVPPSAVEGDRVSVSFNLHWA